MKRTKANEGATGTLELDAAANHRADIGALFDLANGILKRGGHVFSSFALSQSVLERRSERGTPSKEGVFPESEFSRAF